MTLEVISPRSHELQEAMKTAQDMDQVISLHEKFLDTCLKECLLASQDLLKVLTKLMTTCLLFSDQIKRFSDEIIDSFDSSALKTIVNNKDGQVDAKANLKYHSRIKNNKIATQTNFINKESSHESYQRILNKFATTFDSLLGEFLEKLWTDSYR